MNGTRPYGKSATKMDQGLELSLFGTGIRPYDSAIAEFRMGATTNEDFLASSAKVGAYESGWWTVIAVTGLVGIVCYLSVLFFLLRRLLPILWREKVRDYPHAFAFLAIFNTVIWLGLGWTNGGFPSTEIMFGFLAVFALDDQRRERRSRNPAPVSAPKRVQAASPAGISPRPMSDGSRRTIVLFEPWSLGDVLIAASAMREFTAPVALACHSAWHPIMQATLSDRIPLELIPVDLPYTTRTRSHPFDVTQKIPDNHQHDARLVLSIRGDFRDFLTAKKLFPQARIRMNGWIRFFGRKSALVNAPFALGLSPVQNRYRSWAQLLSIPFQQIEKNYRQRQLKAPTNGRIVIHVGAQWRSKQFPDILGLRGRLTKDGYDVSILAGPKDTLPDGIPGHEIKRSFDEELVEQLRSVEHVITNDSGPMHLAAFLGCRTTTIVRVSPIEEWRPPAISVVAAASTPRGYRPIKNYMSDGRVSGWPEVSEIVDVVRNSSAKQGAGEP